MPTFENRAQLVYSGGTVNSNTARGEILNAVQISKSSETTTYGFNDEINYVISIVNDTTAALTGLTVEDNLGAFQYTPEGAAASTTLYPLSYADGSIMLYVDGVLQPTPAVTKGNGITITGISIPANGNAVLMYRARVNEYAPLAAESTITNQSTVSGGGLLSPVTAENTVTSVNAANLTINKNVCPKRVADNGRLTYSFDILNYGNTAATAEDNVRLIDTFNPILSDISVTYNGAVLPAASYTYDTETGLFQTVAGAITVPAATYTQNPVTGEYTVVPGEATVEITGTI